MREAFASRHHPARLVLAALPLGAFLFGACAPEKPGGYAAISHREAPRVYEPAFPNPPEVSPSALAALSPKKVTLANPPAGVTQAMVDEGSTQFGGVCSACHGTGGVGTPAAPALDDKQWLNIDGSYPSIVAIIKSGVQNPKEYPGVMLPRGGGNFTDEQVAQIGAYVYAISQQGEQ